jgi:hypothetical protein
VPIRRAWGNAEDFGLLISRQPSEVTQFDQPRLERIVLGELSQGPARSP